MDGLLLRRSERARLRRITVNTALPRGLPLHLGIEVRNCEGVELVATHLETRVVLDERYVWPTVSTDMEESVAPGQALAAQRVVTQSGPISAPPPHDFDAEARRDHLRARRSPASRSLRQSEIGPIIAPPPQQLLVRNFGITHGADTGLALGSARTNLRAPWILNDRDDAAVIGDED